MTRPFALGVARNAGAGLLRYGLAALVALWVTRYMLAALGGRQFGVWALAGALVPVLRLLDLGLGRALTRAVAEAAGRDDLAAAGPAWATARRLATGLALLLALLVWLCRDLLVRLADIPLDLAALAGYVVVGTAVVAAVEGVFAPYQAALDGLGRMDLTSAVDTAQRLASVLGVVVVLSLGWGLPGLVWKNIATALGAGLAYRWLARRHGRSLVAVRPGPPATRDEARALLAFGRHVQAVNLSTQAVEPVTKALLSRVVGLEAVTMLDLALRVTGQLGGAFLALGNALFPAAVTLRARAASAGEATDAALVGLYRPAARYVTLLVLPAFGLLAVLASPFVEAWLGQGFGPVAWAIRLQAAGWLVALLAIPAFLLAQAGGHVRLSTVAGLTTSGLSIGLAVLLVRPYGYQGIVLAGAAGLAAGGLVVLALFARRVGLGLGAMEVLAWRPWLAAAAAAALAGGLAAVWPAGLWSVCLAALVGLAAYTGMLVALGALGPAEWAWLSGRSRPRPDAPEPSSPAPALDEASTTESAIPPEREA